LIVHPPTVFANPYGELVVEPNVELRGDAELLPTLFGSPEQALAPQPDAGFSGPPDPNAAAGELGGETWMWDPNLDTSDAMTGCGTCGPVVDPILGDVVRHCATPRYGLRAWLPARCLPTGEEGFVEPGIGHERVMHAPFMIDTTQPQNRYALQFFNGYGWHFPDRSEYLWAKTVAGRGPRLAESTVDLQEIRALIEIGGPNFSTTTMIPIRMTNPAVNPNHAGLGDMTVTTKLRMFNGSRWQVTQIFRTFIPTASPSMGLGTGHVALEPGLLFRYAWSNRTYVHSDLKYWFAIGGDPLYSGQVFRWSLGFSHLWWESDEKAIIPTLEFVQWTALNGLMTSPFNQQLGVDGDGMLNIHPGLRFIHDTGGDWGLFEYGIVGGFSVSTDHWYDSMIRFDARWVY
jgi:hypothetical protein